MVIYLGIERIGPGGTRESVTSDSYEQTNIRDTMYDNESHE